jgi:hypothetical protein
VARSRGDYQFTSNLGLELRLHPSQQLLELDAVLLLGVGDTKAWFIPDSPQGARDKQVQDQDTSVKDASSKDTSSKGCIVQGTHRPRLASSRNFVRGHIP